MGELAGAELESWEELEAELGGSWRAGRSWRRSWEGAGTGHWMEAGRPSRPERNIFIYISST
jgi:hypothetical protein